MVPSPRGRELFPQPLRRPVTWDPRRGVDIPQPQCLQMLPPPPIVDASPPKTKHILSAATAELFEYFAKCKCPRNRSFCKDNANKGIDGIIGKQGMKRGQASSQRKNWKGMNYDNSLVKPRGEGGDYAPPMGDGGDDSLSTGP